MGFSHLRLTLAGSQDRRVATNGVNTHTRILEQNLGAHGVDILATLFPSGSPVGRRRLLVARVMGRLLDRERDRRVLRDLANRHAILVAEARRGREHILQTDVIHAQDHVAASALWHALGRDLPPMVLAYHMNGTPDEELRARFDLAENAFAVRWTRARIDEALEVSKVVVPVSRRAAEPFRAHGQLARPGLRVEVIENGIALPRLEEIAPVASRPPVVVSLGQLVHRKGYDVLLKALSDALPGWGPSLRSVEIRIAGDGPLRQSLEADAARLHLPVRFLGSVDRVGEELDEARVFVLPSREENLPMALLEAMAHGLPSVASAVGGIPDALGQGPEAGGALVPPENPKALADALYPFLVDPELCAEVGRKARRRIEDRYTETHMLRAYATLYRTVAGSERT